MHHGPTYSVFEMVFDEDQARLGGLPIFGFAARSAIIIKRRFSTAKESYWTTEQPAMPNRAFPHTLKVLGDPEQIETVRLGTRALKAWRKNHPKIRLTCVGPTYEGSTLPRSISREHISEQRSQASNRRPSAILFSAKRAFKESASEWPISPTLTSRMQTFAVLS